MATPLINGVNYSWSNVTCVLFGVPVVGITEISYNTKQKKDNNYGIGVQPISRGYGNVEYTASIKLYLDEWIGIINASPSNDPTQIPPFNIQIVYGGTRVTAKTDVLQQVEFLENPVSTKQGDGKIEITIPLIVGGIAYNV
jgi:hypothetical protein